MRQLDGSRERVVEAARLPEFAVACLEEEVAAGGPELVALGEDVHIALGILQLRDTIWHSSNL